MMIKYCYLLSPKVKLRCCKAWPELGLVDSGEWVNERNSGSLRCRRFLRPVRRGCGNDCPVLSKELLSLPLTSSPPATAISLQIEAEGVTHSYIIDCLIIDMGWQNFPFRYIIIYYFTVNNLYMMCCRVDNEYHHVRQGRKKS